MTELDIEGSGLTPEAFHPNRGSKYSPNLYAWLTVSHAGHRMPRAKLSCVYVDEAGLLWIGYESQDAGFVGQQLRDVMARGIEAGILACRHGAPLRPLQGFWRIYAAKGRCAMDTAHSDPSCYGEHRWTRVGDTRQCQWCGGGKQLLTRWLECQPCEAWQSAADVGEVQPASNVGAT